MQVLGAARGKHYDLSVSSSSLLPSVAEDMAKGCPDPLLKDELGWCRPADRGLWEGGDNIAPLGLMPNKYFDVSSRGAKMARTCSFISAVWCEMLRAYSVSCICTYTQCFHSPTHMLCSPFFVGLFGLVLLLLLLFASSILFRGRLPALSAWLPPCCLCAFGFLL